MAGLGDLRDRCFRLYRLAEQEVMADSFHKEFERLMEVMADSLCREFKRSMDILVLCPHSFAVLGKTPTMKILKSQVRIGHQGREGESDSHGAAAAAVASNARQHRCQVFCIWSFSWLWHPQPVPESAIG